MKSAPVCDFWRSSAAKPSVRGLNPAGSSSHCCRAITDSSGRIQQCNPAYSALVGYTEEELRAIDFASLIHPDDLKANLGVARRLLAGEIPFFEIENRYRHKDGPSVWVTKTVSRLPDETAMRLMWA